MPEPLRPAGHLTDGGGYLYSLLTKREGAKEAPDVSESRFRSARRSVSVFNAKHLDEYQQG